MNQVSGGENDLPLCKDDFRLVVMDHGWSQKPQAGVAVFVVVPGEEVQAESAAVLDRAEAIRKVGTILQGPELTFRIGIVVGNIRTTVSFGDAEVGQQKRDWL